MNFITLYGNKIAWLSYLDRYIFFEWTRHISSITSVRKEDDTIYIEIVNTHIPDEDLRKLIALFFRYNLCVKQLAVFFNEHNRHWFYDNPKAFWHEKIFS